jgi:hypothetical protein
MTKETISYLINLQPKIDTKYTTLSYTRVGKIRTLILMWVKRAQDWVPAYANPKDQCDVYSICGTFTTCEENKLPCCSCMEGFSVRSPDDWELDDGTGGCTRNTPLDCGSNTSVSKDGFYPMPCVDFPDGGHEVGGVTSAGRCAQVCLGNCNCTAYSYGRNRCFVWDDE